MSTGSKPLEQIDEAGLAKFRARFLSLKTTFSQLLAGAVSERIPQGVGKSHKADKLISSKSTYKQFDIVIYVAPTKAILTERRKHRRNFSVSAMVFTARPRRRCGPLDSEWSQHERLGRTSYAKRTLCTVCPHSRSCPWPRSLKKKIKGKRAIFCTEQHLINDPSFLLRVTAAAGAERVLLILDEAKLAGSPFEVTISRDQMREFSQALERLMAGGTLPSETVVWIQLIEQLLNGGVQALSTVAWDFANTLNFNAFDIQQEGVALFGNSFRYIGYQLTQFKFSRRQERWWTMDGALKFIARPYLQTTTLILSANLPVAYLERQLGIEGVQAPYEGTRVLHSQTRIFNLRSLTGAASYFDHNRKQILDFFARMIRRNIMAGRTTMLVSRKKFKAGCARYLGKRLKSWGFNVTFIYEPTGYTKLKIPKPTVVPIIHFGIVGINTFSNYACCYCLNSYYISEAHLNQVLQSAEPEHHRIRARIQRDSYGYRKATVEEKYRHSNIATLADIYLRVLELDPVLQAVGRCRFFTKPREVIFFQTNDLRPDLGDVTEFASVGSAATFFSLPAVKNLDSALDVAGLKALMDQGHSLREAARTMGIDKSTASRMLQRANSLSQKSSLLSKKGKMRQLRRSSRSGGHS